MATLQIRKKSLKTWLHIPSDGSNFILSKFYCKTDANTFKIVEESGSNRREYSYTDITVYDDTAIGTPETFENSQALMIRLEALKYTGFNRDGDIPTSYIESVVAGTNVTIDNTDPLNPIISSTGGGGTLDLQDVTDNGNTTTNDIIFDTGVGIILDNGSKLKEGSIDAGYGGSKGIAQICAVGYELKWEAGRLYVMGDGGTTIREVSHNFTTTPTVYDDITKGFVVGSRWILDDGTLYICTDNTDDTAVWVLQPTLSGYVPYTGATADLDMGSYNLTADHIALNVSPSGAGFVVGATQWNNSLGSSETLLKGGNVALKNGVDLVARVVNKVVPNTTLTKAAYQVVKVSGASGQKLAVDLAKADTDLNSADTLGIVTETITTNQEGFILTVGQLLDINTTGSLQGETWVDGDVLYLSPTTAGKMTNVKPNGSTGHIVVLGYVEYSHASQGKIYVKIMNGWELDELHNVYINDATLANDQVLTYDFATSLWKNKAITQGTPLVRQEFSYTASQIFTLSATPSYIYAVFVNGQELNSSQYSFVTTTLTIADTLESGDKINILYTPVIAGVLDYYTKAQIDDFLTNANIESIIGQASGSNSGYLSSTDWIDFDAKQDAITLTTNNYNGVATFVGNTLNIPNYEGFIPKLRGHETFRGVNYSNNSTTEVTSGGITIATTGSTIARAVASTNYASKQVRKGFYGSTVSAGRYTGTRGSALLWFLGGGFKYVCDVYISDSAFGSGCRQFYGMIGQTSDLTYSDSILVETMLNVIGIGSDALDTNLQVFHNDGSGTCTKINLGANFPANRTAGSALTTVYSIEIYSENNASEVKYCVRNKETGDVVMGTITTNLPLHTQGLNFTASRCMGAGVTNTGQFDLLTLGVYSL